MDLIIGKLEDEAQDQTPDDVANIEVLSYLAAHPIGSGCAVGGGEVEQDGAVDDVDQVGDDLLSLIHI